MYRKWLMVAAVAGESFGWPCACGARRVVLKLLQCISQDITQSTLCGIRFRSSYPMIYEFQQPTEWKAYFDKLYLYHRRPHEANEGKRRKAPHLAQRSYDHLNLK